MGCGTRNYDRLLIVFGVMMSEMVCNIVYYCGKKNQASKQRLVKLHHMLEMHHMSTLSQDTNIIKTSGAVKYKRIGNDVFNQSRRGYLSTDRLVAASIRVIAC